MAFARGVAHVRRWALRLAVAAVAFAVLACETAPTPPPTSESVTPTGVALASPPASGSPTLAPLATVPPPPPPTTTAEKVQAAVEAGRIDAETAIVYRIFALHGDPRVPEDLRGEGGEDVLALDEARQGFDGFKPEAQALLRPYLVRPTHPESFWNQEAPATAGVEPASIRLRGSTEGDGITLAAPTCVNGWMSTRVSTSIPVMVWSQCNGSALDAQALMEETRGYIASLWAPMTGLMGRPPGDQNFENDGYDDMPETGDGLIDFYMLSGFSPQGHVRDFAWSGSYAFAAAAPPFEGPQGAEKSSGYLVFAPGLTGLILESTLAHEFFHILQYANNRNGLLNCSGQPVACTFHWFTEASATWAEHRFVPAARAIKDGPYENWDTFRKQGLGLTQVIDNNGYRSWMWALFLQQELGRSAVGDAWRSIRGKVGWAQVQAGLDNLLPFTDKFRDFGVRVWNTKITTTTQPPEVWFFDPSLDDKFPRTTPEEDRRFEGQIFSDDGAGPSIESLAIESLHTKYLEFGPAADVHKLTFDFTALGPEVDVDALVQLSNGTWERRRLPAGQVVWCLDEPKDSVQQGVLVFSNHEQVPGTLVRTWSVDAVRNDCSADTGGITFSSLYHDDLGNSRSEDVHVDIVLRRAGEDSPYAAEFLNDGSSYSVTVSSHSWMGEDVSGCVFSADATGTNGGALAEDSVVGGIILQQPDPFAGPSAPTEPYWVLGLGISVPVHYEVDENWCAGGTVHTSNEGTVQIPNCDGIEDVGAATPTSRTFVFDCDFQGDTLAWSISGSVVVTG